GSIRPRSSSTSTTAACSTSCSATSPRRISPREAPPEEPRPSMGRGRGGVYLRSLAKGAGGRRRLASPARRGRRFHPIPCPFPIAGKGFDRGCRREFAIGAHGLVNRGLEKLRLIPAR